MPVIQDLAASLAGRQLAPLDCFQTNRRSLNLVGYEGIAMIAVSGIDMAIWDALAKAANLPLAILLGGTLGRVPAYNSNGLWLTEVGGLAVEAAELVAEGGFTALKLRLGRDRLTGQRPIERGGAASDADDPAIRERGVGRPEAVGTAIGHSSPLTTDREWPRFRMDKRYSRVSESALAKSGGGSGR